MSGEEGAVPDGMAPFAVSKEEQVLDLARLEIDNGFRQVDLGIDVIRTFLEPDRPFALRPSLIQQTKGGSRRNCSLSWRMENRASENHQKQSHPARRSLGGISSTRNV